MTNEVRYNKVYFANIVFSRFALNAKRERARLCDEIVRRRDRKIRYKSPRSFRYRVHSSDAFYEICTDCITVLRAYN